MGLPRGARGTYLLPESEFEGRTQMKLIANLILIFVVVWFVAAFFNFGNSGNTVVGYRYADTDHGRVYYREGFAVSEERGVVTTEVAGSFWEYEDCQIFDRENWLCTLSDNSGTFGFNEGVYQSSSNLDEFPGLDYLNEEIGVPRFQYMLGRCSVNISDNTFGGLLNCAILPFSDL